MPQSPITVSTKEESKMNLSSISKITKILTTAVAVATAVQQAVPDLPGAAKMEAVKQGVKSVLDVEQVIVAEYESLWSHVASILSGIVQAFKSHNLLGFTASKTDPTSLPPSP